MPIFEFTAPDGKVYEIEGPPGSTEEEAWGVLRGRLASSSPVELPTRAESIKEELAERSIPGQIAAGVGASAAETYYGIKDLAGQAAAGRISEALGGEPVSTLSPEEQQNLEEWRAIRGGPATVGRVVGDIAQIGLPAARAYQAARVGGPLVRALAPLSAESATVGAYEGLKPPEPGETRAGRAGAAAALNLALGAGMNVAGRPFLPKGFPKSEAALREERMLRGLGIEPRLPLSLAAEPRGPAGKALQWFHQQPLMSMPGTSRALRGQISRSLDDWREAMFLQVVPERARGEILLPRQYAARGIENPAQQTFKNIDDWYSREYKRVLEPYDFQIMSEGPARRMAEAYENIPTQATRREVQETFGEILAHHADEAGNISGRAVSTVKQNVRRAINRADDDVAYGLRQALEGFETEVERQLKMTNMPHAVAYAELRAPYRNLVTLEKAAAGVKGKFGEVTPDEYYRATISKAKREQGPRAVAQGRAPLQGPAQRAAGQVYTIDPTRRQANSVFQLGALAGITGLGGVTAPVATGGIWGGLLATVPYRSQRWLMQGSPLQQPLRRLQRARAFQEALSAGRAGVTTGVTD